MPELVLDASAAGKLFRNEPGAPGLRAAVHAAVADGNAIHAPTIFQHEVLNIVARTVQEGFLTTTDGLTTFDHILDLVTLLPFTPADDYEVAHRHGITAHDAAYIAAASPGATLLSYDKRQIAAAAKEGLLVQAPGREEMLP